MMRRILITLIVFTYYQLLHIRLTLPHWGQKEMELLTTQLSYKKR